MLEICLKGQLVNTEGSARSFGFNNTLGNNNGL